MSVVQQEFFVAGGALQHSAPSYVVRVADTQLFDALMRSDFCYVLTPRQMGKSSLMVRTSGLLADEGTTVAVLDLTAIGQNLDLEKWYSGLIAALGQQLDMEDELDDFWWDNQQLGLFQRWMAAIRNVLLARFERLVIFVDEIDVVRSLPFSTDEFFAGVRACYNHRSDDDLLNNLTFCLLGVATPSDLIQDTRMTPFNIGRRIELHDFSLQEAMVLAEGLSTMGGESGQVMLRRILHWTGGHPYLTQRLCRSVAKDESVTTPQDVDRVCGEVFLSQAARQQDSNLLFVQQRVLGSDQDRAGLLEEYDRVYRQRRIKNDERSDLHATLRLSGIVRTRDGYLEVRNEVYRHVYDRAWVKANMPDAELKRQRAAFRKGLLRASAVAAVVIVVLAALAATAVYQRRAAEQQREIAQIALRKESVALEQAQASQKAAETASQAAKRAQGEAETAHQETKTALEKQEAALAKEQQALEQREKALQLARDAEAAAVTAAQQAKTAQQQAEKDRELANIRQREAEESAEVALRREKLFGELLPLLAEHAAEGVNRRAKQLQEEGQPYEAFIRYAEFADLALGETGDFSALELFNPDFVSDLRPDTVTDTRITVGADALYTDVLQPALTLGETLLDDPIYAAEVRPRLVDLYTSTASLLNQNLNESWTDRINAQQIIFDAYDRPTQLQPNEYSNWVQRAVSRYRMPDRDLSAVLADMQSAIEKYSIEPQPVAVAAESVASAEHELARLHHAKGNLLEQIAEQQSDEQRLSLLKQAEDAHEHANSLDSQNPRYQLGMARAVRKQATSHRDTEKSRALLQQANQLIQQIIQSGDTGADAYNEAGQIHLVLGEIVDARADFQNAVRVARESSNPALYTYLCNLADAYTRSPTDVATCKQALQAADEAISLDRAGSQGQAQYYRGLALWHLATNESAELADALAAFSDVAANDARHFDAVLTKAQIVFEDKSGKYASEVDESEQEIRTLLDDQQITAPQRAKAYYVYGLAHIRRYVSLSRTGNPRSERSLVDALQQFFEAADRLPEYLANAKTYFDHAEGRTWQNSQLEREAARLIRQFNALTN